MALYKVEDENGKELLQTSDWKQSRICTLQNNGLEYISDDEGETWHCTCLMSLSEVIRMDPERAS